MALPFNMSPLAKLFATSSVVNVQFQRYSGTPVMLWGEVQASAQSYQPLPLTPGKDVVVYPVPLKHSDNDQSAVSDRERAKFRIWTETPDIIRTVVTTGAGGEQLPPDRMVDLDTGKVYEMRPAGDHLRQAKMATAIAVLIDDDSGVVP